MTKKRRSTVSSIFHGIMVLPSVLIIAISPFVGYHFTSEYLLGVEWLPHILVVLGSLLGGAAAFLIALAIFGRFLPEDMFKGPTTR